MSKEKDKSVVAKNATAEERAREYAVGMLNQYEDVIDKASMNLQLFSAYELMDAYLEALSFRDTKVAELREALKEAVSLICQGTEYEVEIKRYREFVNKAKQLLEDEKKETV